MSQFIDFLSRIIKILNEISLNYVVVGGVAVIISGRPRTTTDLDLIVEKDINKIKKFIERLKQMDFDVSQDQIDYALKEGFQLSIFDNRSFLRIDLTVASTKNHRNALNSAREAVFNKLTIKIPSIEEILYGKILYIGRIEDVEKKELLEYNDVIDFIVIYNANNKSINIEQLRAMVSGVGLLGTLNRILKLNEEDSKKKM